MLGPRSAAGQDARELQGLAREIQELRDALRALQKEMTELKAALGARQPAATDPEAVVLQVEGFPVRGETNARLTLIEFSDYECPFCARHARQTMPQLQRDYIQTGKVKYVVRHFPLEAIHKEAFGAAAAANCAGERGKYWEMHDRLFAHQSTLKDLAAHAAAIGLETAWFQECLGSDRHAEAIRRDISDGQLAGVRGTPAFFIGVTDPNAGTIKPMKTLTGAHPYATFKSLLDGLLETEKP
jgi:protein-disulfide isomerase